MRSTVLILCALSLVCGLSEVEAGRRRGRGGRRRPPRPREPESRESDTDKSRVLEEIVVPCNFNCNNPCENNDLNFTVVLGECANVMLSLPFTAAMSKGFHIKIIFK